MLAASAVYLSPFVARGWIPHDEGTFAGDKVALVLGSEGKGLRQKTRETVTALARLDMPGAIKSLNVSNAAAVALYATRQHLAKAK